MAEYLTDLDIGEYKLYQSTDGCSFTQDSVLLANIAKLGCKDAVLDLGCGSGILATLAVIKKKVRYAVGIDFQPQLVYMATRSAAINGLNERLHFVCADVKDICKFVDAESYDKVLCNPPYFAADDKNSSAKQLPSDDNDSGIDSTTRSTDNLNVSRRLSRTESTATLDDFVSAAAYSLKFGGDIWIVIKAARLAALMSSLTAHKLEPKELILIYPKLSAGVDTCIVSARKGAGEGMTVRTLICRNEDGTNTPEFEMLYK